MPLEYDWNKLTLADLIAGKSSPRPAEPQDDRACVAGREQKPQHREAVDVSKSAQFHYIPDNGQG